MGWRLERQHFELPSPGAESRASPPSAHFPRVWAQMTGRGYCLPLPPPQQLSGKRNVRHIFARKDFLFTMLLYALILKF